MELFLTFNCIWLVVMTITFIGRFCIVDAGFLLKEFFRHAIIAYLMLMGCCFIVLCIARIVQYGWPEWID